MTVKVNAGSRGKNEFEILISETMAKYMILTSIHIFTVERKKSFFFILKSKYEVIVTFTFAL